MKPLAFLFGFLYAVFAGKYLIPLVTKRMYDLVDPNDERQSLQKWQPPLIGVIERVLYVVALLAGHGGFIGLWVGLKVGIPYIRWSEKDENNLDLGRALFMNSLYGNALSILYAVVGYHIIQLLATRPWYAVLAAISLIVFNLVIWIWLESVSLEKREPEKQDLEK